MMPEVPAVPHVGSSYGLGRRDPPRAALPALLLDQVFGDERLGLVKPRLRADAVQDGPDLVEVDHVLQLVPERGDDQSLGLVDRSISHR